MNAGYAVSGLLCMRDSLLSNNTSAYIQLPSDHVKEMQLKHNGIGSNIDCIGVAKEFFPIGTVDDRQHNKNKSKLIYNMQQILFLPLVSRECTLNDC